MLSVCMIKNSEHKKIDYEYYKRLTIKNLQVSYHNKYYFIIIILYLAPGV